MKKTLTICVMFFLFNDIAISQDRVAALYYYQKADSLATEKLNNAWLIEITCDDADTLGRAFTWNYCYESLKISINFDTTIFDTSYHCVTGQAAISSFVLDSDSAMSIAEDSGGREFRRKFNNYEIKEKLGRDSASPYNVWRVIYTNIENNNITLGVGIDANTGRIYYFYDTLIQEKNNGKKLQFQLNQNYPNPFNSSTKIKFSIPKSTMVTLTIYNVLGEKVHTLINRQLEAGDHSVEFNSNGLMSGLYFYRLKTREFIETKKIVIQK